jgi:copper chaperone CopZ
MSTTVTYNIPNINCNHCVHTITTELSDLPGVKMVQADKDAKVASVTFDAPTTDEQIKARLAEINYPAA